MRANLGWHLSAAIVCMLLVGAITQVEATIVNYTYMGSNYTQLTGLGEPGLTSSDHMTITGLVLDSSMWGTTVLPNLGGSTVYLMTSGPITCESGFGPGSGSITTDSAGNVIAWSLAGFYGCLGIEETGSVGRLDGSGGDGIAADGRCLNFPSTCSAGVTYGPGVRPAGTGWSPTFPVPEPSSLIALAIAFSGVTVVVRMNKGPR